MTEDEKKQALENIEFIKEIVLQTKNDMSLSGSGWIAIIWGIFCYAGIAGSKLLFAPGQMEGVWWMALTVVAVFATFLFVRAKGKAYSRTKSRSIMKWFFLFWIPLLILAYTLTLFTVFLPGLSPQYITIFILLVISTGYLILGLLFFKEMLFMGVLGMVSTIITAIFFLEHNEVILSLLFGTGLIISGVLINRKWRR